MVYRWRGTAVLLGTSLLGLGSGSRAWAQAEDITVSGQAGVQTANGVVGGQAGGGLIQPQDADRSVSTVGSDYIRRQAATENAFQLLSPLPGAVVAQADALGLSAENSLTVRGLGTDEIGYVLNGMPLNDIAYYTGYPGQFLDTENLQSISLSQGTGDLDTPTINASGGLVTLDMRDPAEKAGAYLEGAYGSYHTARGFARVDTGELGHSGVSGFVSYSREAADNWRGSGRDRRQHVDVRLSKDWGSGNSVSLIGTWNDAITSGYPYVTQAMWKQYGRQGPDNYDGTYSPGDTNYWQFYQQPYRLFYAVMPVHLQLGGGRGAFDVAPYAQYGYGTGPGGEVLPETGLFQGTAPVAGSVALPGAVDGQAVVRANYQQESYRSGLVPRLSWTVGQHRIEVGGWYDYSDDREPGTFTGVDADGGTTDVFVDNPRQTIRLPDGQQLRFQDEHSIAQVEAAFVGDHWSLLRGALVLDAGFREVLVERAGWNGLPGASYRTGVNSAEPLPRVGGRWQIDRRNQVFASVSTNFRSPAATTLFDSFDPTSGALVTKAGQGLRDEYSIAEEVGYRRDGDWVIGSVTAFNYDFTNRQIATETVIDGVPIGTTLNAGGQTSRGVDAEVGLRPWHHLSPYLSGEYLHATIDDDLPVDGDLLPTKGHTAVRSPEWSGTASLTYDDGRFFGVVTVRYVGAQYASFTNDEKISDHTEGDVALGVRLPGFGAAKHPELKLNLLNVTDEDALTGVAAPALNARDTVGRYGTLIAGAPATYIVGGGFAALLSLSTAL